MSTATKKAVDERVFEVGELTRVEGEGSLRLRVRDGEIVEARLGIFETPRYFEQRPRAGRTPDEVDRHGRAHLRDLSRRLPDERRRTRSRTSSACASTRRRARSGGCFYCGEWIESHALHIYLLHAPDFLGYPSALDMAADHRPLVEQALRMKKAGNQLVTILGGRPDPPGQRPRGRLEPGAPQSRS